MNKDVFFDVVRPLFGKLNQQQVDSFNRVFESYPEGVLVIHMAYAMATAFHETAATMQPITEYGPKSYFNKYEPGTKIGKNLGNTQHGDGYKYRGRGFVQLTGRANYVKAGKKLEIDLVGNPDLALDFDHARHIMRAGMDEGWFTGKKLDDYLTKDKTDYRNARRIINGMDCAEKIAGYAKTFEEGLEAALDA